jgi:hypothetical protein
VHQHHGVGHFKHSIPPIVADCNNAPIFRSANTIIFAGKAVLLGAGLPPVVHSRACWLVSLVGINFQKGAHNSITGV